jgi:hypothetical protein
MLNMHIKTVLAVLGLVTVLATAPDAFAFGGGGKRGGGGGAAASGISGGSVASISAVTAPPVSAAEPFAGLAVGLGLLGARLLRRR